MSWDYDSEGGGSGFGYGGGHNFAGYHDSDSYEHDDYYGESNDDDDDEEENDSRTEELKQFMLNFHRGNYDDDFETALNPASGATINPYDQNNTPADREKKKSAALVNLQLQKCIRSATGDVGLLSYFHLKANSMTQVMMHHEQMVSHDQSLNPYWKQLENAFSQPMNMNIRIHSINIVKVEMKKEHLAMLATNLRGKVSNLIQFNDNNLCGDGIMSISDLLEHNPVLYTFHLCHNPIDDLNVAMRLSRVLKAHLDIETLKMTHCNIGNNVDILSAILRSDVKSIDLSHNNIGLSGAVVISEYLETNPPVKNLTLDNNRFDDESAILFAQALRKNTNLEALCLKDNNFTLDGAKKMIKGLFDSSSLNAISESNHTCKLYLFSGYGDCNMQDQLSSLTLEFDRMSKILIALQANKESLLQYLEDVPVELMPGVIALFHTEKDQIRLINMIHATMRWWNMPSLYSYNNCRAASNPKRKRDNNE
mmetsp:Transcript_5561/g.12667  ORF Transcript_5561/g.12667 Transcript_5561/m.12667 type:complete len:481 (-) Transcript_5561:2568-4010(-)